LALSLSVVSACTLYSTNHSGDAGLTGGSSGRGGVGGDSKGGAGSSGRDGASADIDGSAGGAAGAPTPPPACGADAPASGASCAPTSNADCRTGGYACGCACGCGAYCTNVPPPCTCPPAMTTCTWSCYFQDFASLVDLHSLAITVGCANPSAPTMTLSIDTGFRAAADGPALTIKNISPQVLGAGPNAFVCTLPAQSLIVGPIAPGTEQPATLSVGPTSCTGGTALNTLCSTCGGSARVALLLEVDNDGSNPNLSNSGYSLTFGRSPSSPGGTPFPIACTH